MPGRWMQSGSRLPAGTISSTSQTQTRPQVAAGTVRPLGVATTARVPQLPDAPTIAEQGLPGFEAVSWFALFAPAGTPKAIVDKLQAEVSRQLKSPDVARKLAEIGLEPVGGTAEELAAYQRAEIVKWAKVVKDSGAKAE